MKKKSASKKHKSSLNNHSPAKQSFWFRLWIGILIGSNIGFVMLALNALTNANPTIRAILPLDEGIVFIVLGLIDIFFMIRLLQFRKFGLYGTFLITLLSLLLNIYWHADILWSLALSLIPIAVTLSFVLPQWRHYK